MLAGNGGSVLFYVVGHDEKLIRRLVEFLQQSDFVGVIFTKERMEGTFMLAQAKIAPPSPRRGNSDHAPDVSDGFSLERFKKSVRHSGNDRRRLATSSREGDPRHTQPLRHAQHVDCRGPGFSWRRNGRFADGQYRSCSDNFEILGIKAPLQMDGRILSEMMINVAPATGRSMPGSKTIEAKKDFPSGTWRQSLQISRVGPIIYLDEGNGAFTPK